MKNLVGRASMRRKAIASNLTHYTNIFLNLLRVKALFDDIHDILQN